MEHVDLYREKSPSYYGDVRKEVISLLPENAGRILEIGCGNGATLAYFKSLNLCQWAGGVELTDAIQAPHAGLDLLIQGNIEAIDLPIDKESLDVILCLDVLEHLVDPWDAVKKLSTYLRKGGVIIASLPNIRNVKVLVPLIFGDKWTYVESGILDRTHLRFFTLTSAIDLFQSAGMVVEKTPEYFSDAGQAGLMNKLTFSVFRRFLQFQYLLRARK